MDDSDAKELEDGSIGESDPGRNGDDDLDRLREVLVGPERREIVELRERLDQSRLQAPDVADVLPHAIAIRAKQDDSLSEALTPTIEGAIEGSVRRNPHVLADAIFPLMGPAIRKSIRQSLDALLEGINRSMEHNLSLKGVRWRMEARRTGRTFAEIVLKHSLVFRVEQVLLIHRETALLLEHVVAPATDASDPDMVSGMLGAIQDFVSDSFSRGEEQRIDQVEFGDLVLEIARGPTAVIACVVRGTSSSALRREMQETIERVHAKKAVELAEFDGDATPFVDTRTVLADLVQEKQAEDTAKKGARGNRRIGPGLIAFAVLVPVLVLGFFALRAHREQRRWERALATLESEPGIVLTLSRFDGGEVVLRGLKDPLAADPVAVFEAEGLAALDVDARFGTYHSLEPAFVLARAKNALAAPKTVSVSLESAEVGDENVLVLRGRAKHAWVRSARRVALGLPGVQRVDESGLVDVDLAALDAIVGRVESRTILFSPGSIDVDESGNALRALELELGELADAADEAGLDVFVTVVGHASTGENDAGALRSERADALAGVLRRSSGARLYFGSAPASGESGTHASLGIRLSESLDPSLRR